MSLFLISFLGIYGCLHAYAFFSLRNAFRPSPLATALLLGLMLLMIVSPILIRLAERSGREQMALTLAWPGFIWMGALLLFVSSLCVLDLLRLAAWCVTRLQGTAYPALLSPRLTCEAALLLTLCITIYSFFEARAIRSEHLTVASPKIPPTVKRIRIAQISDVHVGLIVGTERLNRILTQVRQAEPDILVSTGDLVDGRFSRQDDVAAERRLEKMLADLPTPLGKFAVLGNHDVYVGIGQSSEFTRSAGFRMLRFESFRPTPFLSITGVDDPAAGMPQEKALLSEQSLLKTGTEAPFKLLLKHRPKIASDGMFDLQLSGHTHQGQIFPFTLLVRLQYPLTGGTLRTAAGSTLHVSRGSGTWGPPLRFLAPPEVTIIDLVPDSPK